ncbi:acyltransferase [Colwellia sp. 6M3]|uniref:acyltransferase family protein n=1 Tax=Colwellia sp. 6M3 TaxID=2759849 RepID=UPI0015F4FE78|nr:acyltransferase family protein [Colwellia sp. 6M3]MBA6417206.1 acyltransferase [Colwellia sp. 6M3]
MNYRSDIDGLRTIAVFLVILNHTGFNFVPGGFVGVDVFFVISGFLITSIIYPKIVDGSFEFSLFLSRRIKRLMPVLFFVMAVSLVVFTLTMLPQDLIKFYYSIIWVSVYVGNIFFWLEHGGYFDGNSQEVPLLHTWSLAIEEQYYIVWPIFLILSIKFLGPKKTLVLTFLGCIAATIFSQWGTEVTIGAAYYLLPTRFFELMAGSCLAMYWSKLPVLYPTLRNILSGLGLVMIIASSLWLTKYHSFPGYNALYSVLGTILIIYGTGGWVNRFLSTKAMVFTGNISYSLYLWHWPILVYLNYTSVELTLKIQFASILATYIISILSWKYIEQPFRTMKQRNFRETVKKIYLLPTLVLIVISLTGILYKGYPQRFSPEIVKMDNALNSYSSHSRKGCHSPFRNSSEQPNPNCLVGEQNESQPKANVFIIGDSHANHFVPFLEVLIDDVSLLGMDYTLDQCVPVAELMWGTNAHLAKKCQERNRLAYDYIEQNSFEFVVLAASWPALSTKRIFNGYNVTNKAEKEQLFTSMLIDSVEKIVATGAVPIIVEDTPSLGGISAKCPIKNEVFKSELDCSIQLLDNELMKSAISNVKTHFPTLVILTPSKLYCHLNVCSMEIKNTPLYRDDNHLNEKGAKLLGEIYLSKFGNPLVADSSLR